MTEKIVDRIRKLLELSKSSNEHEAALAAGRAAELMVEHQIAAAELETHEPSPRTEPVGEERLETLWTKENGSKRLVSWKFVIASGVAIAAGGVAWKWFLGVQVVAPESALPTIRYMYSYLCSEIERLADVAYRARLPEGQPARTWKGAFRMGAANEIAARLVEQRESTLERARQEGKTLALAIIDRQAQMLDEYQRDHYPIFYREDGRKRYSSSWSSSAGRSSVGGYMAGRDAGRSVNLGGNPRLGAGQHRLRR